MSGGGVFVPWLVDAARLTGYPVVEVPGWQQRGHGGLSAVEGVVAHHTAGPAPGDMPSLAVVRDGRADLRGPLAQLGLGRSGTIYVIAAGLCYHAGKSQWAGMTSLNARYLGIEAESVGDGSDWTPEQLDAYPRLAAALLHYMRRDAGRLASHAEVALPAGRKIDPAGIDMRQMRATVTRMLGAPLQRIPRGSTDGDTMTPDQARLLAEVHELLTRRHEPWQGGTGEALTVVDLLRRANVEQRQVHPNLIALHQKIDAVQAKLDYVLADAPATAVEIRDAVAGAIASGLTLSVTPAVRKET